MAASYLSNFEPPGNAHPSCPHSACLDLRYVGHIFVGIHAALVPRNMPQFKICSGMNVRAQYQQNIWYLVYSPASGLYSKFIHARTCVDKCHISHLRPYRAIFKRLLPVSLHAGVNGLSLFKILLVSSSSKVRYREKSPHVDENCYEE